MSIEKIIQESVNKNPLAMKEALEEELRGRLALALEAKMQKEEDDMEDDEDDMEESFDLSDLTLEELEDFIMSEDFDQLDEISKDLARRYIKGAKNDMAIAQKYHRVGAGDSENTRLYNKRKAGVAKATSRFAKESFDLSDLTLEELEDFMFSEDFDQLDEISKKKVADYMDKSHDEYKSLQQKGGAAGGSSVMNAKQKRRYATGSAASDNAFKKATGRARVNATD